MQLHQQFIPSRNKQASNLTLIHGWAAENAVWLDWAKEKLSPYFNVYLIELPGFGQSPSVKNAENIEEEWLALLANALPEKTHLLGWSLGGLLSQKLALQHPEKVQSLICLASTPRFTQQDNWPNAVSPQIMANFIQAMAQEFTSVLKNFWNLQLQGSDNARTLMKRYAKHMANRNLPTLEGLNQGLILLRDMDNRPNLKDIPCPILWLLGEKDPLIPLQMQQSLEALHGNSQVKVISGASHMSFFSHPEETAQAIIEFIQAT